MNERLATERGRYHHRALRADLLRVAREEIARHGAGAVTLASLARLAGVSQPAPYHHSGDRKALLEAVAAEAFDTLTLAYLAFGEANIEIYRLMFASRVTAEAKTGSPLDVAANAVAVVERHRPEGAGAGRLPHLGPAPRPGDAEGGRLHRPSPGALRRPATAGQPSADRRQAPVPQARRRASPGNAARRSSARVSTASSASRSSASLRSPPSFSPNTSRT